MVPRATADKSGSVIYCFDNTVSRDDCFSFTHFARGFAQTLHAFVVERRVKLARRSIAQLGHAPHHHGLVIGTRPYAREQKKKM